MMGVLGLGLEGQVLALTQCLISLCYIYICISMGGQLDGKFLP